MYLQEAEGGGQLEADLFALHRGRVTAVVLLQVPGLLVGAHLHKRLAVGGEGWISTMVSPAWLTWRLQNGLQATG